MPLAATSPTPGISPGTAFTPVVVSTLTNPEPVQASDGKVHLAYELVLTNAAPFPARIDKVEVLNAVTGRAVLVLTGAALRADLTPCRRPARR
jgi:hypothetical protein